MEVRGVAVSEQAPASPAKPPATPPRKVSTPRVGTPRKATPRREGTAQTREGTADRLARAETPRTPESQRATPRVRPGTDGRAQTAPGGTRRRSRDGDGETPRSVTPGVGGPQEWGFDQSKDAQDRKEAQERAKLLMRRKNMTSTYTDAFTAPGGATASARVHTECFRKVIRPEYLEHIHAWQEQEPDVNHLQR